MHWNAGKHFQAKTMHGRSHTCAINTMSQLFLVRHGQASLGAANYDQLSLLGHQQSVRLGQHWRAQGLSFDAVISGTLQRHAQTLAGIQQGLGADIAATPWPGLNEYDSEALIKTVHTGDWVKPTAPDGYKAYFKLLRKGLQLWMAGETQPQGMPSYTDFSKGVLAALAHISQHHRGRILLISSGGPIATAVAYVLGISPAQSIELNMRMRNSAVTEFHFTPHRHSLISFNHVAHLETPEHRDWVTYA